METFTSIGEAINAAVQFDREKFSTMPSHVQEELTRLAGVGISPVDRIVRTGEMLYANRAKLTRNVDRQLVARLIEFGGQNGWHGLNENSRADRIKNVMLAEGGDTAAAAVAAGDVPTPLSEFTKADTVVDGTSARPTAG